MTSKKLYVIGISIFFSVISVGLLISFILVNNSRDKGGEGDNVEVKNGVQYVTITAKGGYFPRKTVVSPDIPTKLIVKTKDTYDCSSSLVVREADFNEFLQPSGEVEIDLGSLDGGQKIQGLCSMGMYSFEIVSSLSK